MPNNTSPAPDSPGPNNVTSDPASPPPAPTAPKVHRSIINQAIQNYITEAETFLDTAKTAAEINPVMEAHGCDATELDQGYTLLQNAADAFGVRLTGISATQTGQQKVKTAEETARYDYAAFREIARACFPAQEDRVALALTGNVPVDLHKFVTLAHTSYTNAAKAPWPTKLTKRNYAPARLTTLNDDNLTALAGSSSDAATAAGEAIQATETRDNAYNALKEYMKEIMGVARGAFRGNAGALAKLKL